MKSIVWNFGFEDVRVFMQSTFHPKSSALTMSVSGGLGTFAYYFEGFLGFEPIVGLVMIGLFIMELFTGIKASIMEGNKFESQKFGRAWLKMFVYLLMIGFAHVLAVKVNIKPVFGMDFNYYEWMHYTFFNYVLIQLFISNIENFNRLGWDEFIPMIGRLTKFLKIKIKKDDEKVEDDPA